MEHSLSVKPTRQVAITETLHSYRRKETGKPEYQEHASHHEVAEGSKSTEGAADPSDKELEER